MIRKVDAGFPKKHALGLDPRDHAPSKIESTMPIQLKAVAL
jgi:hypothetical protein